VKADDMHVVAESNVLTAFGACASGSTEVRVLGCFELVVHGLSVPMPIGSQRVLGFLAVAERPQRREVLAGRLWGDSSQAKAQACLRNVLWQIRRASPTVVTTTRDAVQLAAEVGVDLVTSRSVARRLLDGEPAQTECSAGLIHLFEQDLLPAWEDDWIVLERERTRQLRIHALEALSGSLLRQSRFAPAIDAAYAAVAAEPLRESAHAALIEAYLAEGNRCEALRQLGAYRRILDLELGLVPSPAIEGLLADFATASR